MKRKVTKDKAYVFWIVSIVLVIAVFAAPYFLKGGFSGRVIEDQPFYNSIPSEILPCDSEYCSGGGGGGDSTGGCTDECLSGQMSCSLEGNIVIACGNYDLSDSCLEWGNHISCEGNSLCQEGQCVLVSDDVCESHLLKADVSAQTVDVMKFDLSSGSWSSQYCSVSLMGGECGDFYLSNIDSSKVEVDVDDSGETLNEIHNVNSEGNFIRFTDVGTEIHSLEGDLLNTIPLGIGSIAVFENGDAKAINNPYQTDYKIVADRFSLTYHFGQNEVFYFSKCPLDPNAICGDGEFNQPSEECDDGNTDSGDGCNSMCENEFCGDGVVQNGIGEQCDDGNTNSNDRCSVSCLTQRKACVSSTSCGWVIGSGADSCSTSTQCGTVPPSGGCFTAETMIKMADGSEKEIQNINVGDLVLSYNENTGKDEAQKVLSLFPVVNKEYLIVNSRLKVTADHPVWLSGEWVRADSLKVGNVLKGVDDKNEIVMKIVRVSEEVPVYNFEVENTHTYYADGVRVHNAKASVQKKLIVE